MLQTLRNAFKVPELRKKLLWTILLVAVFRMGSHIPLPGINSDYLKNISQSGSLLGFYDLISGGAFSRASILALGVMPYINSSIIIQLLTVAIPQLEQLSKEGDSGRKKIQNATRYVALVISFVLAYGIYATLANSGATAGLEITQKIVIVFTLVVGSTFCMWLGDQVTVKGIGNGTSILIFVNIISRIPTIIGSIIVLKDAGSVSIVSIVLFTAFILLLLAAVLFFSLSERRIPVQYAGKFASGNNAMVKSQSTHIPLSIIGSAVLGIIFSMSVMEFPRTIATLFGGDKSWAQWILTNNTCPFNSKSWSYIVIYAVLTIFFNWFYMQITFKPDEMSENLHKSAGFIPGIRPGEETTIYFEKILNRLAVIGGVLAAILAVTPILIENNTAFKNISFSGTSLLIMINVALDFTRKVESQMVVRHYKGFLRKNISENTSLGIEAKSYMDKGQLVPDEVTINMVKDRLSQDDCKEGYLLDGFPRTVAQAEALDSFLKERNEELDTALAIEVPNEFILERMTGRRVCPSCGASYHIKFNPPADSKKCDLCGTEVIQRKDDTEETVKERLEVYGRETQPLIDYYADKNKLSTVDGTKAIIEVFRGICEILENKK